MKKILALLLTLLILCTMAGCNFTTNFSDSTGNSKMQAISEVETLMEALADEDLEEALTFIHPNVSKKSLPAITQMADYLEGRGVKKLEQQSVSVNTTSSITGKARQENGTFKVILQDNTVIYISAVYLENNDGKGFVSFQLVLGLV